MPRIVPLSTLRVEDYPAEERKWLPRLLTPLNQFLTSASSALNGRIDFVSNIPAQDVQLEFTYDGSAQRFRWNLAMVPKILWVGQASEANVAINVSPSWVFDSSTSVVSVAFQKLPGGDLTVGQVYRIFVRAVP